MPPTLPSFTVCKPTKLFDFSRASPQPASTLTQAAECRSSLASFFRHSWAVLEPTTPLDDNWHIDAICAHVQAALEGWRAQQLDPEAINALQNLIINVPPGTAKSRIVNVATPAWMWIDSPQWKAIFLSANPRVALRDSVYCRDLIESDWYRDTFRPNWRLSDDQNAKSFYRNTAGGSRLAMGFGSRITGDRGDFLGVDDPHDAEEVNSIKLREAVTDRWDSAVSNRVNDLRSSVRIGIMQRLHEADWSGHNLRGGRWEHLLLPMEFVTAEDWECECESCKRNQARGATAIGWSDPRSEPGEALFDKRFPAEILETEKVRLGEYGYAGQMQQSPVPAGGAIFKEAWFDNRYEKLPVLRSVWTIWDTALKAKQENDESACATFADGEDGQLYVLRAAHGRWETPVLAEFLIQQAYWFRDKYGDRYVGDYVEDKVSGITLMQYLRRHEDKDRKRAFDGKRLALIPISPGDLDKVARAQGVTPLCEAERVRLPDTSIFAGAVTWVRDLIGSLTLFPKGTHDDLVDVLVYGVKRWNGTLGSRKSRRGKTGGQV
jgi:predicted phage terminase large subunit-like protein